MTALMAMPTSSYSSTPTTEPPSRIFGSPVPPNEQKERRKLSHPIRPRLPGAASGSTGRSRTCAFMTVTVANEERVNPEAEDGALADAMTIWRGTADGQAVYLGEWFRLM